ncbi:MAG: hypothetical protein ACXAD7_04585 [Candidatus Kariarchaeaceae archaeon]
MSSQDWSSFVQKNDFMEVAELVAPLFREKITDEEGNPARFISVLNIDYQDEDWGDILNHTVDIQLHSDQGQLTQKILIREFQTPRLMEIELNRFTEIEQRCQPFPELEAEPMININTERLFVVYEKVEGTSFEELQLQLNVLDYLMGRISAILQGPQIFPLDENTIREMMIFLLMNLPFTDEERASIVNLLEKNFEKIGASTGGYLPCTLFHPNAIIFQPLMEYRFIDNITIDEGKAFKIIISNLYPENLSNDRISDFAVYYHTRSYNEFLEEGEISIIEYEMQSFLEGYNNIIKSLNLPSLKELYPQGNTLNLQLLSAAWLQEAEKVQSGQIDYDNFEERDFLRYTYYLLLENPFLNSFQ